MDSPGSGSLAPDTPFSQGQTTAFHSMISKASPSRSPSASVVSASSPLLSSPGSPKVDDGAAGDVQPRHLGEEAAGRIPETLAEADEAEDAGEADSRSQATVEEEEAEESQAALPTTPTTKHASAFGFASQPMALDLSPVRSISTVSSPASSPRKNAHRRQNTNTISVAAHLPPASVAAARQRFDSALGQSSETPAEKNVEEQQRFSPRTPLPQTPTGGILSSTKKGLPQLSAAQRGHSVRFSPRPDYRSDSGSWDESGTQSGNAHDESDSRDAAVSRLLLPAKQITIPEILTSASIPASVGAVGTDEEEEEEKEELDQAEESAGKEIPALRGSPVKVEVSKPHTPASPAVTTDPAAASFSSVRFPGAYAATPVKQYSRHVIRPSPNITRILPDNIPAAVRPPTSSPAARQYSLFPTHESSHIPRESTPPPTASSKMMPPDDPRNSPRSPRPVDLGREQFARFDAGSSSEESSPAGSIVVEANTAANERRESGEGVSATIGRILQTVEAAHGTKLKRMQLGERLNGVSERMGRMGGREEEEPMRFGAGSSKMRWEELARQDEADRERMDELRRQVMHALAVLADRIVALQTQNHVDSTDIANVPSSTELNQRSRRGLSRRTTILLVLLQCAIIAWLLALAERKAEHLRMYHPPPHLSDLSSPNIQWNALAISPHLQPLLHIPLLHQLYHNHPPLPSPTSFDQHLTPWQTYKTYIRLHGLFTLVSQLTVYAVSQLIAYTMLLVIAPLQVVWIVLDAHNPTHHPPFAGTM